MDAPSNLPGLSHHAGRQEQQQESAPYMPEGDKTRGFMAPSASSCLFARPMSERFLGQPHDSLANSAGAAPAANMSRNLQRQTTFRQFRTAPVQLLQCAVCCACPQLRSTHPLLHQPPSHRPTEIRLRGPLLALRATVQELGSGRSVVAVLIHGRRGVRRRPGPIKPVAERRHKRVRTRGHNIGLPELRPAALLSEPHLGNPFLGPA